MGRMAWTRTRHTIHRGDAHAAHQGGHLPSPNGVPLLPEEISLNRKAALCTTCVTTSRRSAGLRAFLR